MKNRGLHTLYIQLTFIKTVIFATYYTKYWGPEMSNRSFPEGIYWVRQTQTTTVGAANSVIKLAEGHLHVMRLVKHLTLGLGSGVILGS